MLKDKIFLVTGGTGSFGKTIALELEKLGAKEVRIFSRDEKKQEDEKKDEESKNESLSVENKAE